MSRADHDAQLQPWLHQQDTGASEACFAEAYTCQPLEYGRSSCLVGSEITEHCRLRGSNVYVSNVAENCAAMM